MSDEARGLTKWHLALVAAGAAAVAGVSVLAYLALRSSDDEAPNQTPAQGDFPADVAATGSSRSGTDASTQITDTNKVQNVRLKCQQVPLGVWHITFLSRCLWSVLRLSSSKGTSCTNRRNTMRLSSVTKRPLVCALLRRLKPSHHSTRT